jgi:exosortase
MLIRLALDVDRYTHVILVPVISMCVFYFERRAILRNASYAPRIGLPLLGFGLVLFWYSVTHPSSTQTGSLFRVMAAIVVVWLAAFFLCYGARSFRAAAFPLCFLLLMIPAPAGVLDQVTVVLQKGSAYVSYLLFKISGTPVFRQGFLFSLPGVEIEVADQCSGIRSSLALLITSILAGHFLLRAWWSRGLLVLLTIPMVIFKNSVRIVTIATLGIYVNRAFLYGELHRRGGLLFALLGVLMLVPVLLLLQGVERRLEHRQGKLTSCV